MIYVFPVCILAYCPDSNRKPLILTLCRNRKAFHSLSDLVHPKHQSLARHSLRNVNTSLIPNVTSMNYASLEISRNCSSKKLSKKLKNQMSVYDRM